MKPQNKTQRNKMLRNIDVFAAIIQRQIKLFNLKIESATADATLDWAWYYAS